MNLASNKELHNPYVFSEFRNFLNFRLEDLSSLVYARRLTRPLPIPVGRRLPFLLWLHTVQFIVAECRSVALLI